MPGPIPLLCWPIPLHVGALHGHHVPDPASIPVPIVPACPDPDIS